MSKRSRELANDLARRAIAAAERRQRESGAPDPDDLAQRLRGAAGADGTLSVDEAVEALTGDGDATSLNDLIREERPAQAARQAAFRERLFGPDPEQETPTKPPGDADGGKGEVENHEIEWVQTETEVERMRVFDLDNPEKENQ
ncbi:MAG: hypothetical protein AABM66_08220 [Actinomycetota bacterium]